MAFLDYGVIVLKNGKLRDNKPNLSMKDSLGWSYSDDKQDWWCKLPTVGGKFKDLIHEDCYTNFVGDEDLFIAFSKTEAKFVYRSHTDDKTYIVSSEDFNRSDFTWFGYTTWFSDVPTDGKNLKVYKQNGYFVLRWKYKGNNYKVYFGQGVDYKLYKKYHLVNYFRSPKYFLNRIKWTLFRR